MKYKPTVAQARRFGAHFGWAHYKHRLIEHGIIKDWTVDVPEAWKQAFVKANGRKL